MSEAKPLPVSDWMTEPESAEYCRCSLASFRNMRLPASNSGRLVSTNSTPPQPTIWPIGFRGYALVVPSRWILFVTVFVPVLKISEFAFDVPASAQLLPETVPPVTDDTA